ncbi:hypothetical protein [Chitinophaga niabensis]|uniref:Uncharacterized protein n=1 Tax=Chitinophaga niabensis TaxID=536979 RepID=A0A1N6K5Y2_9BACT|nr:hypothetical protein [Chitinophaga niabensis]SIO51960.1 hypothetical protein SAMN04488055_5143 [Chitinophaga niabensis]
MARKVIHTVAAPNLEARLKSVLKRTLRSHASKNIPIVYKDQRCKRPNEFIHEYPDGRKFLICQSRDTSSETVLRRLK